MLDGRSLIQLVVLLSSLHWSIGSQDLAAFTESGWGSIDSGCFCLALLEFGRYFTY